MASWIIHLRVAQRLYQQLHIKEKEPFVLGNIAPDSGIPNEDGTGFVPDAAISHFRSLDQNGIKCIHDMPSSSAIWHTCSQIKSGQGTLYTLPKKNTLHSLRPTAACSGRPSNETGMI